MENGQVSTGEVLANGHAMVGEALQKIDSHIQEQENIFLFIPNIIGKHFSAVGAEQTVSDSIRLHPHCPRHLIPLLHASTPANMLSSLQPFLHP
jgi:hypothetical protein